MITIDGQIRELVRDEWAKMTIMQSNYDKCVQNAQQGELERVRVLNVDLQDRYDRLRAEIACVNVELGKRDRDIKSLQHSCEMHRIDKERLQQRIKMLEVTEKDEIERLRVENEKLRCYLPFDVDPNKFLRTWRYGMVMRYAGREYVEFTNNQAEDGSSLPGFRIPREDWDKMGSPVNITVDWSDK